MWQWGHTLFKSKGDTMNATSKKIEAGVKKRTGLDINIIKGKGYFYFSSPDKILDSALMSGDSSLYVCHLNHMELDQWVNQVVSMLYGLDDVMIFQPSGAMATIPQEFREKWAAALMESTQHKGSMVNLDDTAHCCLCVAAQTEGATWNDYADLFGAADIPDQCAPITKGFERKIVAETGSVFFVERGFSCRHTFNFSQLNDNHLTHPEIARLVLGETVVIPI